MIQSTEQKIKKPYMYMAAISIILLLSAAIVTPSLSAYADHDNGNHKSKDDKKQHKKDRKGKHHKEPERCEHGSSAKYNKHCDD